MNAHVNSIGNRLSLRDPQRESLEILARVAELIKLEKGADPAAALAILREEFKTVEDFERNMPGLAKIYPGSGFTSGSTAEPTGGQLLNPFGGAALTDGIFVG